MSERRSNRSTTSVGGLLARVYWMAFGNLVVLLAALYIVMHTETVLSWADGVFWAGIASLIGVRYLDVKKYGGLTSDGEPATMQDFKSYSGKTGGVGGAVWGTAQSLSVFVV
ncbi:MAG: hypothetical protein ACQEXJ_14635 [Myxococcota bacterium]